MDNLVLSSTLEPLIEIDTFDSYIWTDRFKKCGDFELSMPMDPNLLTVFKPGNYLWSKTSRHLMCIEDLKIISAKDSGNTLYVTGRSLESLLDRRVVWPMIVLDGKLEDGVFQILDENIMNPIDTDRKMSNFIFVRSDDATINELTLTATYTGDNLYDLITGICESANIGFQILMNEDEQFEFSLYAGVDRSRDQMANPYVTFSPEFGNLVNSNYILSSKTLKNVAIVNGSLEDYDNTLTLSSGEKGLNRKELYTSATGIKEKDDNDVVITQEEYDAQLTQLGEDDLAKNTVSTSFDGECNNSKMYQYNVDYFVGDYIQLENEYGIMAKARITEIISSQTKTGTIVYPSFVAV